MHQRHHHPRIWDRAEAVRLYLAGHSSVEVGRRLGIDPSKVSLALKEAGVRARRMGELRKVPVDTAEFRRLYSAGVRVGGIASRLGLGRAVVDRLRRELGLPPFRPGRPGAKPEAVQ